MLTSLVEIVCSCSVKSAKRMRCTAITSLMHAWSKLCLASDDFYPQNRCMYHQLMLDTISPTFARGGYVV